MSRFPRLVHRLSAVLTAAGLALVGGTGASAAPHPATRLVPAAPAPPAAVTALAARAGVPHTVTFDRYSLKIDGRRLYVWAGELHYWRLPSPDLWRGRRCPSGRRDASRLSAGTVRR
jgi:hypothetical protein